MRPLVPPRVVLPILLGCATLTGWTLLRALEVDPRMPAELSGRSSTVVVPVARAVPPSARLAAAVGKDPFHPDRRRPAERFRLPGESLSTTATAQPTTGPSFQLIGTAVMPQGRGFAMCQWGVEPPRLVRVGERVGDLTLKVVAQGRATFVDAGGRTREVRVPKAGT